MLGGISQHVCKPGSVLLKTEVIIIYLAYWVAPEVFATYPKIITKRTVSLFLFGLAPCRVYLVSLQHNLYILSVALVLTSRWTGVTRYGDSWCPDFPRDCLILPALSRLPEARSLFIKDLASNASGTIGEKNSAD